MPQSLNLKIKGLFTSFNEFSEVPEGALLEADNVDIIQDSVCQPRRGFDRESGGYSDITDRTDALFEYEDKKLAHHGSTIGSADTLSYYNAGSWTSIESVSAPSSCRMKSVGANENFYYTSSSGLRVIDAYNGTARAAGAYKGLDITSSISASTSTWLDDNYSVAYRVVWFYKDSNNNYIYGAPSQREVIYNQAGSQKAVDLVITIPTGVTTSWFFQIYRSRAVNEVSAGNPGTVSDELYLVYESNPTSGQISAKSISVTDIVPEDLLGATLYTASSQEGIGAANEPPPVMKDLTYFDDVTFGLNTVSKHRFYLTVISTGASSGVQTNDTIAIGGITYTAKTSETVASAQFKAYTSATDPSNSAAQNIDLTARSLVRVINQYSSSTVYAYYLSGPDDLPGKILLEERSIGGNSFAIVSSRATCWSPTNIPTSGTTVSSTNDAAVNRIQWSKPNQPESWPLTNFAFAGSKNDEGLRIKALRDAVYIFKKSGEVYKLTGTYPNYQIDKIEDSVKLVAKESLQVLNNQLYCLSDQGITVISDSTKVISRPIEQDLLSLVNQNYSLVQSIAFGVSYEADRKYYIFLPGGSGDTYPTQAYVYNIFTNSWVRHTLTATCGLVDTSNNFYLGDASSNYLLKERRNYSFLDYADYGFSTSIDTINSGVITIASGFDEVDIGDIIYQSASLFAQVESVDALTQSITLSSDPGLTVASCTILKGIATRLKWVPVTFANPSIQKQLHTVAMMFKSDFLGTAYLGFISDLDQSEEQITLEGRGLSLWGLFPWGEEPWGGESVKRPLRQWIPLAKQRASQLTLTFEHSWGFSAWVLEGVAVFGEVGSEKTSRM